MTQPSPFFFYSKSFPSILKEIGSTLVFSTYQAGKLIFISSTNGETIIKYAKNFKRPMGIAYDEKEKKLAIASKASIDIFSSSSALAASYPEAPGNYDELFIPQAKYFTGRLDTHEIGWKDEKLWIVNTMFSCLSTMDHTKHFLPEWQPSFISELVPEDRCHLNGMAFENNKPKYASCFSPTNTKYGWKGADYQRGMLIDIDSQEVILDGLAMPHSPVVDGDYIYFLQSATGTVNRYHRTTKKLETLNQFNTFVRGLEVIGDYIFFGASKIREESTSFKSIPVKAETSFCGIWVLNKHTGKHVGGITYTDLIKEIFSVKILRGVTRPGILTEKDEFHDRSVYVNPKLNFWMNEVPKETLIN